jgi:hypothetical protein
MVEGSLPPAETPIAAAPHPDGVVEEVEEVAREVEEEVEGKAAIGFLGGPYVWGLLVILALLLVYGLAR